MKSTDGTDTTAANPGVDRRGFLSTTGAGLVGAGLLVGTEMGEAASASAALQLTEKNRLDRIASCSYPLRALFKSRGAGGRAGSATAQMKQQYGEITMLDFPQFTKDTFPGVTHMDVWSSLFGDVTDDSMFVQREFDPSSASGRKWLERFAAKMSATGTKVQHISNNAPTNLSEPDDERRKAGVEVAKKWLDAAAIIGARSMRVNSGGPRIAPIAVPDPASGYPKNDALVPYLEKCIESFKEMADYGGERGVKVTLENHWGLTANPMNIIAIVDEVNHPYCEASPDFCNWEHEYLMYHGLKALAPYSHTNVHAKYWSRWKTNDVRRSTRIMLAGGFKGTFALEYEEGPWDGVEGSKYLFKEVMAALSSPF
jgi:sugar phosphate isomerase/epimerase